MPRGSRLSEALGPPLSRVARYKFMSAIPFMAGRIPAFPGGGAYASAKRWDRHSPEWLGTNVQVDDFFHGRSDIGGPIAPATFLACVRTSHL